MRKIAVVGGGMAGSAAARELSARGLQVVLIEKTKELGGNIREYGCKATEICTKCNLCLVDQILQEVQESKQIKKLYESKVRDLRGQAGHFTLTIERDGRLEDIEEVDQLILATGFTKWSQIEGGLPEVPPGTSRVLWASELEELLLERKDRGNIEDPLSLGYIPEKVVFLQCNGSRSIKERARFCSRVCCGYSFRMAMTLKKFYPELDASLFFIDLQTGGNIQDLSFRRLEQEGIGYMNCKPIKLKETESGLIITYEDRSTGKIEEVQVDLLILSEGMHPGAQNQFWAELCNFQLDDDGFLYPLEEGEESGIFLAGSIAGPGSIADAVKSGKNAAYRIISRQGGDGNV